MRALVRCERCSALPWEGDPHQCEPTQVQPWGCSSLARLGEHSDIAPPSQWYFMTSGTSFSGGRFGRTRGRR